MTKTLIILILAIFLVNSAQAFSKEQIQKIYLKKPTKPISTKLETPKPLLLNQTEVPACESDQAKNVTVEVINSSSLRGAKDSKKASGSKKEVLGSL